MKKILIVFDDFNDGAGNMAQILYKYLSPNYDVYLLMMDYRNSNPRYDVDSKKILIYDSKNKKRFRYLFYSIKFVKNIIKKYKFDTVVSFLDNINSIVSLSLYFNKTVNLIVSERSNPLAIMPSNKFYSILRRIAYKRANFVSVQFDDFKYFENSKFISKCVETPNIILPAPYKRTSRNDDNIIFISCARFASIKRFDLLIKLFNEIYKKNSNCRLILCGDGPERMNIENLINKYNLTDAVNLVGNVKNIYQYLKNSDIYLMTSLQEGFPNSLSEGLATGLPAVVFACHNGIKKLVVDDFNGYCIDEGKNDEFVKKCLYLSMNKDLINKFGDNSIKIANEYSYDKILSIWENLL